MGAARLCGERQVSLPRCPSPSMPLGDGQTDSGPPEDRPVTQKDGWCEEFSWHRYLPRRHAPGENKLRTGPERDSFKHKVINTDRMGYDVHRNKYAELSRTGMLLLDSRVSGYAYKHRQHDCISLAVFLCSNARHPLSLSFSLSLAAFALSF